MRPMLVLLVLAALAPTLSAAAVVTSTASVTERYQVWVPGYWQTVGNSSVWVNGHYATHARTVQAPPPATWIAERYVDQGGQRSYYAGYWSNQSCPAPVVVVYRQPAPVYVATPVYVAPPPVYVAPRVAVSIGFGHHGYHHGYHGGHHGYHGGHDGYHGVHGGHHRGHGGGHVGLPLPHLPSLHHALPRPSRHFPDPLGIFRHDPLHLFRR